MILFIFFIYFINISDIAGNSVVPLVSFVLIGKSLICLFSFSFFSISSKYNIYDLTSLIKDGKISGMNVTLPFKKLVIPFLDELTENAKITQSVNTIYLHKKKVYGDNTDIYGFKTPLEDFGFNGENKKALILGAGGVSASSIVALKNLGVVQIILMNRTKQKAIVFW